MSSKVFVGNLDFNTSRSEVETLFAQAGAISDVFLPTDRDTGRPRGFAFVEFANADDAAAAVEKFNGYELNGRALRVNPAEDRRERSGGSFGGGQRPSFGGGPGGGGGGGRFGEGKPKGSRRNIRGKKRSL